MTTSLGTCDGFVERFTLPATMSGPLDGLSFAIKDLIDVAGHRTGCGNPNWRDTHPPAATHAVCVEQLLAAGAHAIGKTITDELAFSLLGENHWYGTPPNPGAPDRMPGGSSSGSASVVAAGLVDFALGTDTGGSVRVPASNCGIIGYRPTHDAISTAGVMPFAPTFDAVGLFSQSLPLMQRVVTALLGTALHSPTPLEAVWLLDEAWTLADTEVQTSLSSALDRLYQRFDTMVMSVELSTIMDDPEANLLTWWQTYRELQGLESWSSLGSWIATAEPTFGPRMAPGFAALPQINRSQLVASIARRNALSRRWSDFLQPGHIIAMPTTPTLALPRGTEVRRDAGTAGYYPRTLGYTALSGISGCPQISLPLGDANGVPMGLSLIGSHGADADLLRYAAMLMT